MSDHDNPAAASKPRRQQPRLSIASLITLVLVLGLWLGWFVRSARIQREAVAAITKAHGEVLYDWECRNGHWVPHGAPWGPRWLVNAIGVDHFGNVTFVRIPGPSEADLSHIGNLVQLRTLVITDKLDLTDAGLAHLKRLKNLRTLDFRGVWTSARSVRELERALPYLIIDF